jgi:hypothetical protein
VAQFLVEGVNLKPTNFNGFVIWVIFDAQVSAGLTHEKVVNGFADDLVAGLKFVLNLAK